MDEFITHFWLITFWHWWALAAILIAIEVMVPSTYLLWPAISAAVVGVALAIVPEIDWRVQLLLFAVLAIVSSVAWQQKLRRDPSYRQPSKLNRRAAALVGRRATLTEAMVDGFGKLHLDDTAWRVRTKDGRSPSAGTVLEVVELDGMTLVVRPVEAPAAAGPQA